jgi:hypothetical protein
MSPWTSLRISGAPLLLPCLFGLGVWVALSSFGDSSTGYSANNLAIASGQLVLTGPLVGAYLAYRIPPFVSLLMALRPSRSPVVVFGAVWSPVFFGGPAAGILAMLSATRTVPGSRVEWQIIGVAFTAGLACAALGALLALVLPRTLAIPLLAAAAFTWIAIPGSRLEVVPRNLNSGFVACCADDQQPAAGMVLGSTVLNLVLALGCLVVMFVAIQRRRGRLLVGIALLAVVGAAAGLGVATAAAAPGKLNLLAVEPRTTADLVCARQADYRACTWPENRTRLGRSLAALQAFDDALGRAGLPRATVVSEQPATTGSEVQATAAERATADELTFSLVSGYVELASACDRQLEPHQLPTAVAVVGLVAGMTPTSLAEQGASATTLAEAQQVLPRAPDAVSAWFHDQTCGDPAGTSP